VLPESVPECDWKTQTGLAPVENAPSWGWYLSLPSGIGNVALRVALIPHVGGEADCIEIQVAPADKVGQARRFHAEFTEDDLVALQKLGWEVWPNFHLSFMQSHVFYAHGEIGLLDYFNFWKVASGNIGRVARSEWDGLWRDLRAAKIVSDEDRAAFDRAFTETGRDFAVAVPGYGVGRTIPLDEAVALDDRNALSSALAEQIRAMAAVLRLKFQA
jgi:hypothetical protein